MATSRTSAALPGLLLLVGFTHAAPVRVATFTEALASAGDSRRPVAVYVHGSSWHRASQLFDEKIWNNPAFVSDLDHDVILTNIHVLQEADPKADDSHKGWQAKTVRSYPALQVYATDGHLLKTWQGREFRTITSPAILTEYLNPVLEAAGKRRELLAGITTAREEKDRQKETGLLVELLELPIANEADITKQLEQADPDDQSGWQARLSFNDWEFIRHTTALINDQKIEEALTETDRLLEIPNLNPAQQALVLGARGKALAATGDLPAAWEAFEKAKQADPDGPNGKAIWRYGIRVAGKPLRIILPPDSTLAGKDIGDNLSREHATFTMSSARHDNPAQHATLFKGPAPSSGYAFHTDQEKDAHIIIDLQAECTVRALRITNRRTTAERAESLTLWNSSDGKKWTRAWSADKVANAWDILFDTPVDARFLKLGLAGSSPEFLHLEAVDIYGTRPK